GGGKSATFPLVFSPLSLGYLGASIPVGATPDTTLLGPGSFTAQSTAGADVGVVNATFTMPALLNWTDREQISAVNRATAGTVNWIGGSGQTVALIGGSVDLLTNSSGVFVCVAAAGASSITAPAVILSNLPPGRGSNRYSKGILFLASSGAASGFSASGIDAG